MVLFDYCEFNIIVKRQVSSFDLHANLVEIGQIIFLFLYTALDLDICPVEIQHLKILTRLA